MTSVPCILASTYSNPFMVFVTLVLNLARPNSWKVKTKRRSTERGWWHVNKSLFWQSAPTAQLLSLRGVLRYQSQRSGGRASLSFRWPLYSTNLNSSREPKDFGGDPSFSFYLSPAAVLWVHVVLTALLYTLGEAGGNKQSNMKPSHYNVQCGVFMGEDVGVPLGARGWCSTLVWSWSWSEGPRWSPRWCTLSWPCALEGTAPSSEALGWFWSTDVWKWGGWQE